MKFKKRFSRFAEIQKIRGELERDSFPRLQMLLLVLLTGASGFVASYTLLRVGISEMWVRYLLSFGIAYLVFLLLLWLWLRTRAEDYSDVPDISDFPSFSSNAEPVCAGEGGDFGGAGASSSFDAPVEGASVVDNMTDMAGEAIGSVADADEFALPLALIIFIGMMILSSLFMVYSAPVLFAELLVDGVLSASLYRRLRGLETRHWLETAVRRTVWPFVITAAIFAASGWGMSVYAPGAHSIGEVILQAQQSKSAQ